MATKEELIVAAKGDQRNDDTLTEVARIADSFEKGDLKPLESDNDMILDLDERVIDITRGHRAIARVAKLIFQLASKSYRLAKDTATFQAEVEERLGAIEHNVRLIAVNLGITSERLRSVETKQKQ